MQFISLAVHTGECGPVLQVLCGFWKSVRVCDSRFPCVVHCMDDLLAVLHLQVREEDRIVPCLVGSNACFDHTTVRQLYQVWLLCGGSDSL